MTDIELRNELNDEQYEAVTAPDGPLLILAAAGTGKTRTLVYRAAYLMSRGYKPYEMLLLTFTNRAASEMLERIGVLCGEAMSQFWGGTFHHTANMILRRFADRLGYTPSFSILDSEDQKSLTGAIMNGLNINRKDFTKREVILSAIGSAVNRGIPFREYIESHENMFKSRDIPGILKVAEEYAVRKAESNAMDFDDLLTNVLKLLENESDVRAYYQEKFKHVFVDEFQDTNMLQARMVDIIAEKNRNITAVGDDFQCIYSWRGSDFRNIMNFPARYPDARIVKLERNYRSTPQILSVANESISNNREQFEKKLRPTNDDGAEPELFRMFSDIEQARKVCEIVEDCVNDGYRRSDIAVLYRAHFHAISIQTALARAGVQFRIISGPGFYEQAHVKDLIAFFRAAVAPDDFFAFSRILSLFPGVGSATVTKIWNKLSGSICMTSDACRSELLSLMPSKARQMWSAVDEALAKYAISEKGTGSSEHVLLASLLNTFYRDYLKSAYGDGRDREDDLNEVVSAVAQRGDVSLFLSDVALLTNYDRREAAKGNPDDILTLCTVHQAKGLEWPVVIIPWLVDGMFPSSRALEDGDDSEERRLFYVAVTRARNRLYMLVPQCRRAPDSGFLLPCEESRFVSEVPETLYRTIAVETNRLLSGSGYGERRPWWPSSRAQEPRIPDTGGGWRGFPGISLRR